MKTSLQKSQNLFDIGMNKSFSSTSNVEQKSRLGPTGMEIRMGPGGANGKGDNPPSAYVINSMHNSTQSILHSNLHTTRCFTQDYTLYRDSTHYTQFYTQFYTQLHTTRSYTGDL